MKFILKASTAFYTIAIALVIVGIVKADFLWYIRAGIVGAGAYFLSRKERKK